MGLGNKVNKFNFGENDLANEGTGADGDSRDEGDGFGAVACSICLETVVKNGDRAWANLQCGHQFHLETNRRSTTNSSEQHSKDMVILSQIDAGNFSEAEALLTQVLELKPYGGLHRIFKHRLLELGDYRSVAKLGMLDYSGALRDISQALALAPNYSESYICQGDVYVAKGQYDLAEKSYLKCLEIDPSLRRSKSFKARIANLQKKVVEVDVT